MNGSKYRITRSVMFARHNLRTPLSSGLEALTPHSWHRWGSGDGELSASGEALERAFGEYFSRRYRRAGLFPDVYAPCHGEVRIFSNSLQRTIASARAFCRGMFPDSCIEPEHRFAEGTRDPFYSMLLPEMSDEARARATEEIRRVFALYDLEEAYRQLERVLDHPSSPRAAASGRPRFDANDWKIDLSPGRQISMTGDMRSAVMAADALLMQLYEMRDPSAAAFGHRMTDENWQSLGLFYVTYQEMCFSPKMLALPAVRPILRELKEALTVPGRRFTGYFGHDSNITGILSALDGECGPLTHTLTPNTPIGCRLCFERVTGPENSDLVRVFLSYQSTETMLGTSPAGSPVIVPVRFKHIKSVADGACRTDDLLERFEDAIHTGL